MTTLHTQGAGFQSKKENLMNYEDLFSSLSSWQADLKAAANTISRLQKTIQKDMDTGNLADLQKNLTPLLEAAQQVEEKAAGIQAEIDGFDTREYFVSGDFTRQLLAACEERKIDVKGEKGIYEMFPYKVRVYGDEERAEEVFLNRKKIPSFRPSYVANTILEGQNRLRKMNFNTQNFLEELAAAYQTVCAVEHLLDGANVSLNKIYKAMTPMARSRREYDMLAFAYELSRTYEGGPDTWITRKGDVYTFGTSRDGKSGIRVLSSTGIETYITTFRLMPAEG